MLLSEVFLPEFINCDVKASKKYDVFKELVDQFCNVTKLNVSEQVLAALKEREAKMSTGIQKGIAIPHGKTTAIERSYGILGVSKKGVDYDSLDGAPVHLVLMILAPPVEAEQHLHLLQRIAEVLRTPAFFKDAVSAQTPAEVYSIIKKYEENSNFGAI
ncbi:MAG: PTS sugar transporter subunit IIA [Spirochaetaceae bacterium]|jgi:PTS system fructose-specific IIC component/PTS system nitrogen regulatory IIA component|nr:PTS sugar transporter subunit IIA [Spirochaetaceae bacterium]